MATIQTLVAAMILTLPALVLGSGSVTTLDDGGLYLFVSDNGTFAFDSTASRDEYSGLYYPRDTYRWVMSGGGIWVAGKVGNQWRVTISGAESEFESGPVGRQPGIPTPFPVYKITREENYSLNDDYRQWPSSLGAPLNSLGQPLIMGSQCLFTVFNDTDTSRHTFDIGGTLPLGVEIRLYAFVFDNTYQTHDTMMTQVVFLDYTIFNRSGADIDSFTVTLYGDPDIGYSANDRVGSDVESGMAFCYDESDRDQYYGSMTPAVGICFLDRTANSTNFFYAYRRTDPSAVKLDNPDKTINLVKGLTLLGDPYLDSSNQQQTKFPFNGNVSDSTGWINTLSKDYRFVINTEPTYLAADDSIKVTAALIVARETTNKESVSKLIATARSVRELYRTNAASLVVTASPSDMVQTLTSDVRGFDWGGRFWSGGLDLAARYFGDTIAPDSHPRLDIRIDSQSSQKAYRFVADGSTLRYESFAKEQVGITNTESGQRIDFAYLDLDRDGTIDNRDGATDPIIVFTTAYSDDPKQSITGFDLSLPSQQKLIALQFDRRFSELIGSGLSINTESLGEPFAAIALGGADTLEVAEPNGRGYSERVLQLTNNTRFMQEIEVHSSDPQRLRVTPSHVALGTGETTFVSVRCHTGDDYSLSGMLDVISRRLRTEQVTIPFNMTLEDGLVGDTDGDSRLTLADLISLIRILYRDAPLVVPRRLVDLNCDGAVGLDDLVILLNVLYLQADIPCNY